MKRIYNVIAILSILAAAIVASSMTMKTAKAQTGPGYDVEPAKTMMGPGVAIGQTFIASINLLNATNSTVPLGVQGVEAHMSWDKTLIRPVSFTNKVGASGGVLIGPGIIYGINPGFFDADGNALPGPDYSNATQYEVAAASTTGPWWGDGRVVDINFTVVSQPQPYGTCVLNLTMTDLVDAGSNTVDHYNINAVFTVTNPETTSYTVTYQSSNYTISMYSDSAITAPTNLGFDSSANTTTFNVTSADGFDNVTIPKAFMSSMPLSNWTVNVDGVKLSSPNLTITDDSTNTYLWFNYTAGSHVIVIQSTSIVPEFSIIGILLLFMAATVITVAIARKTKRNIFHY
jgi:hypothetical protein